VNVVDLASKVRVTANPTTIENGESTTIRVENCPDCTYSWSPATGLNTTTGSTVIASPTDTTEYTVKVTSNGCMAELKITINVSGPYCVEPYIFVPTAFTPNGDGVNDVLYVRGRGIDRMTFIIYNRWGQKMFETSDPKVGWDGTFRGKKLPADVYGFYLLANCIDGTTYRKQGNVTLIR
jgi:gliding motility-associated-like protein